MIEEYTEMLNAANEQIAVIESTDEKNNDKVFYQNMDGEDIYTDKSGKYYILEDNEYEEVEIE